MITISTKQILRLLTVLAWIIFIIVCVDAGIILCSAILTLTVDPAWVKNLWQPVGLLGLYTYDSSHFFVLNLVISIVAVIKAWMFYLILKLLYNKKLNISLPFSREALGFIFKMCYCAFLIGLFSRCGLNYAEWLEVMGVALPDAEQLRLDGADVWLFMCVILFVIAQIFKRGIEIQSENELTV